MKRFLIVAAIVLLFFASIGTYAINRHPNQQRRVKEIVLQQNLWTMRRAIDFFTEDRGVRPHSLDELVSAGYLREILADPFTKSNRTWVIEREKTSSVPSEELGISNIHSGASGADMNGKAYNRY